MLIYGAKPGMGVNIDTKLIHDVMSCFLELYNKRNLTVMLPDILDQLKGSDTNIEVVQSSTLQMMRMGIKCFQAVRKTAYIFVQSILQREGMKGLEYKDAEKRAYEAEKFFVDTLQFDHVEICRDYTKERVIAKLELIQNESDRFEVDQQYDTQAVNSVFVNWVGFRLYQQFHPFLR